MNMPAPEFLKAISQRDATDFAETLQARIMPLAMKHGWSLVEACEVADLCIAAYKDGMDVICRAAVDIAQEVTRNA